MVRSMLSTSSASLTMGPLVAERPRNTSNRRTSDDEIMVGSSPCIEMLRRIERDALSELRARATVSHDDTRRRVVCDLELRPRGCTSDPASVVNDPVEPTVTSEVFGCASSDGWPCDDGNFCKEQRVEPRLVEVLAADYRTRTVSRPLGCRSAPLHQL
jgi:hypothetical protein